MQSGSIPAWAFRRLVLTRAVAALAVAAVAFSAAELTVRRAGDRIHIIAPRMRILEGRTLDRLQNGMTVGLDFQLSILSDGKRVFNRSSTRFVMSYDLWEEKFSVTRVTGPSRSVSHLSAEAAENWCVDQLSFPVAELPAQRLVSIRLEIRVEDPDRRPRNGSESGLTLTDLIDALSRTGRPSQQKWTLESGPFRLVDLKAGAG